MKDLLIGDFVYGYKGKEIINGTISNIYATEIDIKWFNPTEKAYEIITVKTRTVTKAEQFIQLSSHLGEHHPAVENPIILQGTWHESNMTSIESVLGSHLGHSVQFYKFGNTTVEIEIFYPDGSYLVELDVHITYSLKI